MPDTNIIPFDWHRMFLGDLSWLFLLEIAFRTAFLFVFALLVLRMLGKRAGTQLTVFELVVVVALGSAAGDPMFYPGVPLIWGMVVITTIVLLSRLVYLATNKSVKVESVVEGQPRKIIEDGIIKTDVLKGSKYSRDNLMMELRRSGIENLVEVKRAYYEPSGKISVIKSTEYGYGLPTWPEEELRETRTQKGDEVFMSGWYANFITGEIVKLKKGKKFPQAEEGWVPAVKHTAQ